MNFGCGGIALTVFGMAVWQAGIAKADVVIIVCGSVIATAGMLSAFWRSDK